MKQQITSSQEIKLMVDTFYSRVRENELIGPIFNERFQDNWSEHLEKMYRFWGSILLGEASYSGQPFPPHAQLPIAKPHFETWVGLFTETVDELFEGENAEEAKRRAKLIAMTFEAKKTYLDQNKE